MLRQEKKERKTSKFFFCPQMRPLRAALRRSIITVKSRSECFPKKEVVFEERVASCGKNLGLMCGRMNKEVAILEKKNHGEKKNTERKVPQQISHSQNWQSSPREPAKLKVRGKSCISSEVFGRLSEGRCGQVSPPNKKKQKPDRTRGFPIL